MMFVLSTLLLSSQKHSYSNYHKYLFIVYYVPGHMKVKVTQSCTTLCDPMDCIHGLLQARILEWVAVPFCRGPYQPRDGTQVSCIGGRSSTIRASREAHLGVLLKIFA